SSMPRPTNPACSGSCPEPPPDISATLPEVSLRRRTNLSSAPSETISACAAAKPARLSASTCSGTLMSFFMALLRISFLLVAQSRHATRDFGDGFVEQPVAPRVTQVGHGELENARSGRLPDHIEPLRMRFAVRGQELAAIGGGEVTDRENRP